MPRDPEKARAAQRHHRARLHAKKFGESAGDQRGKHGNHAKGADHPRWSDARMISDHGYVKIRVGVEHPLADPNGYAYEHLVVWISAGKPMPDDGEVLHHNNEVRTYNRLHNLILKDRGTHNSDHLEGRERDNLGRFMLVDAAPDSIEHKAIPGDAP